MRYGVLLPAVDIFVGEAWATYGVTNRLLQDKCVAGCDTQSEG